MKLKITRFFGPRWRGESTWFTQYTAFVLLK